MKRWRTSIEVEASPEDAARLRTVLPECLADAGFRVVSSTVTNETWAEKVVRDLLKPTRKMNRGTAYEAEHVARTQRRGGNSGA